MDQTNNTTDLLQLLPYPAFCVEGGRITQLNSAACQLQLEAGTDIQTLLLTGKQEYTEFKGDCLYLTLQVCGIPRGASVKQMDGFHLFLLDQDAQQAALHAYALAARELRKPLSELMAASEDLDAPKIDRGLHQILRLVENMSDAAKYDSQALPQMAVENLTVVFHDIVEKAQTLAAEAGFTLNFTGLTQPVYGLADANRLARAIYNLLANAFKFSPAGSTVNVTLRRSGNLLYFTVADQGKGIPNDQQANVFYRYLRQPGLEDSRQGIGLGMLLVRAAAATHGGTVLLEQTDGQGSRITMTLTLRQDTQNQLRANVVTVDSGFDRGLVELSEILPFSVYENN